MSKSKKETKDEGLELVEGALSKGERFIEENQKTITIVIVAIVAVVAIYLAFNRFYVKPKEDEARKQMFVAEQYFERDSFKLAINGDGNYLGFQDIIKEYGITKSANLAHYYLGISYLKMGKYDNAIEQLKKFSGDKKMLGPEAKGAIGDALMELNKTDEAIDYYLKAAVEDNEFLAPYYLMKAGLAYEEKGEFKKALGLYDKINTDYKKSNEGRYIDKYIQRAKLKIK
ncbi:MAG: tetratricopeptide repeat protein [Bacteroidia bacterium]|nr:tetratricopeptide repeat protein [Bacteroidia bacterium]